jgi:protoporphyrin/coproporphyrin ferrochelatase
VLLLSFGTAETLDDVPDYLARVRGGHVPSPELIAEFQRRFARVGGSPLNAITRAQAAALQEALNAGQGPERYRVTIGMRHAPPFVADGVAELIAGGARRVVGIIMSPQYSPIIMGGYLRAIEEARASLPAAVEITVADAWCDVPEFQEALASRVRDAIVRVPENEQPTLPVFCTAHSLPRAVAEREPGYLQQLQETATAVMDRAGVSSQQWQFAYQSAGHTPEPWLTPDVKDLLPGLRDAGHRAALVVPVQFLADHLEVLYDIDVAAREEAAALGIDLRRTESLNTSPTFIAALAQVVRRELAG